MGIDFNPTFSSYPKLKDGLTLSNPDEVTRQFWIEHGKAYIRISAWEMDLRNWKKALLSALCIPNELLTRIQDENKLTELQVVQDEMKTMPFGNIWDEYCRRCDVKCDREWFLDVKEYEKTLLATT